MPTIRETFANKALHEERERHDKEFKESLMQEREPAYTLLNGNIQTIYLNWNTFILFQDEQLIEYIEEVPEDVTSQVILECCKENFSPDLNIPEENRNVEFLKKEMYVNIIKALNVLDGKWH